MLFTVLDGYRGLFACVVVMYHLGYLIAPTVPCYFNFAISLVNVFFVLSGVVFEFCYSKSIISGKEGAWPFAVKRFSRLWPTIFLSALFVYFVGLANKSWNNVDGKHMAIAWLFQFFGMSGFLRAHLVPGAPIINGPSWSLTIEIICYIAYFFSTAFLPKAITTRGIHHWFWILGSMGYCIWLDVTGTYGIKHNVYDHFIFGLGQFHLGCQLAFWNKHLISAFDRGLSWIFSLFSRTHRRQAQYSTDLMSERSNYSEVVEATYHIKLARTVICFIFEAIFIFLIMKRVGHSKPAEIFFVPPYFRLEFVYCPLFVFFATLHADDVYTNWMKVFFKFMGETSLALYLWHFGFIELGFFIFGHPSREWSERQSLIFWFLLILALFTFLSYPIYRWIEMPAQTWFRNHLLPTPPPKEKGCNNKPQPNHDESTSPDNNVGVESTETDNLNSLGTSGRGYTDSSEDYIDNVYGSATNHKDVYGSTTNHKDDGDFDIENDVFTID